MRKIALTFVLIFVAFMGMAQNNFFYLAWDINTPAATDFVSGTSTNGAKVGFRFFPADNDKFSVGVDAHWGSYNEYVPRQTMQTSDGHITTDYFKYVYAFGLAASGQYYFKAGEGDRFYPYAGLGLGANNNQYMIYYNIYQEEETRWGFLVRPEAGIIVRAGRSIGFMAAAHYDYSTNRSEYFDTKNFSSLGFQLGIVLMNRR
jgi:hypothetical protein